MKGERYSTEAKIRILREAETFDKSIIEVCREKGLSEKTYHRWKREVGMMKLDQAKRLKRLLADEMLGKELLKEALETSCEPRPQAADCRELCEAQVDLSGLAKYRGTLEDATHFLEGGHESVRHTLCGQIRGCYDVSRINTTNMNTPHTQNHG
jgi:transposase-like protein